MEKSAVSGKEKDTGEEESEMKDVEMTVEENILKIKVELSSHQWIWEILR